MDDGAVELGLVHMRDGGFGGGCGGVFDVGCAAIGIDWFGGVSLFARVLKEGGEKFELHWRLMGMSRSWMWP